MGIRALTCPSGKAKPEGSLHPCWCSYMTVFCPVITSCANNLHIMIDYAYPTMMAEKALKDLHNAMLDKKYDEAIEQGMEAIVACSTAISSIKHMKAREEQNIYLTREIP